MRIVAAAAALVVLTLTGCSDDDGGSDDAPTPAAGDTTSTVPEPSSTPLVSNGGGEACGRIEALAGGSGELEARLGELRSLTDELVVFGNEKSRAVAEPLVEAITEAEAALASGDASGARTALEGGFEAVANACQGSD